MTKRRQHRKMKPHHPTQVHFLLAKFLLFYVLGSGPPEQDWHFQESMEGKWTTNSNSMCHFHCWNLTRSQNIFFWTMNLTQPYAKQTACQTSQEMRHPKVEEQLSWLTLSKSSKLGLGPFCFGNSSRRWQSSQVDHCCSEGSLAYGRVDWLCSERFPWDLFTKVPIDKMASCKKLQGTVNCKIAVWSQEPLTEPTNSSLIWRS